MPSASQIFKVSRPGLVHDLDALEVVVDRLAAHGVIVVSQAAELVKVVLEGIGVDRAEHHTKISGVVLQCAIVLDLVPRDMQRDFRREPGQLVHLGSVGEVFLDRPRRARRAEDLEPGAGVAERPGGQLNGLIGQLVGDVGEGLHVLTFEVFVIETLQKAPHRTITFRSKGCQDSGARPFPQRCSRSISPSRWHKESLRQDSCSSR